ncbi:MAG: tetratricopeptide repeat protein [Acidobacteriota bacterium]
MRLLLGVFLIFPFLATSLPAQSEPDNARARYLFTLAKMLAEEGELREAGEAFRRAETLAPDEPYLLIERAEFLFRLASRARAAERRAEQLGEAVRLAEKAAEVAPENLDVLRALGQIHLALAGERAGSLESALAALEGIRRQTPGDLRTMMPLAQIYLRQGEANQAAEVLQDAVRQGPQSAAVYSLLADALQDAGRTAEASVALEKLLELDPLAVQARIELAKNHGNGGDHEAALRVLEEAPEQVIDQPEVRSQMSWHLLRLERYDEALAAADDSLAKGADDLWLRFLRSQALIGLERTEEAQAEIAELRREEPDNLELVRTAADLFEREGRIDEAVAVLEEAIAGMQEERALVRARFLLAGLLARAGRVDDARQAFGPALGAEDREVRRSAYLILADLLAQEGRGEDALEVLASGTADLPELQAKTLDLLIREGSEGKARRLVQRLAKAGESAISVVAAQAAQAHQRYDWSLDLLESVLAKRPDHRQALFSAGAAYERTNQQEKAEASFRRLLALEPDHAHALNYLGYMWAENGVNLEEALDLVQRAVALDPENGAFMDSLGWAHYRLGQYVQARQYLERAAGMVPDDGTVAAHLGDVYRALGENQRAAELYRRALDLDIATADEVRRKLEALRLD